MGELAASYDFALRRCSKNLLPLFHWNVILSEETGQQFIASQPYIVDPDQV